MKRSFLRTFKSKIPSQNEIELCLQFSFSNSLRKRQFYSSAFDEKSDAHKHRPHLKTSQPLSHDTESYFLCMLFFRKFPSRMMFLHFSNSTKQLMYECASINNIRKQSNLSPTTLKTINLSENDVSSTNRVEKDGLHLRLQLNI